jgi:putative membrane protein
MIAAGALHPVSWSELGWTWDPLPLGTLLGAATLYAVGVVRMWHRAGRGRGLTWTRVASFYAALLVLALALLSPLDALSDWLFAAHMSQHELLMVVAAPLAVLGKPLSVYVWALSPEDRALVGRLSHRSAVQAAWRFLSAPLFVLVLHAFIRWVWHLPLLFEAAMKSEPLHAVQHLTFFSSAALFWWALIHGRYGKAGYGLSVLFVFATVMHTSVLGALISVAPHVLYPIYENRATALGWKPLEDQELAGILMWVPSGVLLTLLGLALFAAWLGESERRARRSERAI